jgi:alanyl-tRNA synthetase
VQLSEGTFELRQTKYFPDGNILVVLFPHFITIFLTFAPFFLSSYNLLQCIRAGGKHNDLDDVGKDNYHHTFFEMLGNWSFGDYFKEEAITWAWELLTEVYKIPKDRLYASYFGGDAKLGLPADEEARDIWLRFLPENRVLPFGAKDNFWEMGDQGPCGPCSEIHFDRIGSREVPELVNADDPNVLEIWNLVFMQFNREADGSLRTLPAKHVDTGAGFERVTSVLQGKSSNYATDIFMPIFEAIQKATGHPEPYTDRLGAEDVGNKDMAYRVVADHIRTLCFAIADGSRPGNEGREYVLRRVLRRGVRFGREVLGGPEGFFSTLVDVVVDTMSSAFPELEKNRAKIKEIILEEETAFSRTLIKGLERFHKMAAASTGGKISGPDAFTLWDTFGFPVDLTELMAEESGLAVDMEGFAKAMEEAKELSRAGQKKGGANGLKFEAEATAWLASNKIPLTDDSAKYTAEVVNTKVAAILAKNGFVQSTKEVSVGGDDCMVGIVLEKTPFYAESGGQVADTGCLKNSSGSGEVAVQDTIVAAGYVLHICNLGADGAVLSVGDDVTAAIDMDRRNCIMPNHTFTHILNFALREVLGDHVDQKGSIVQPERLRFDFTNKGPVTAEELGKVEAICAEFVESPRDVFTQDVALAQAKEINSLRAVFGEVYPDPVRVVSVGKSVAELIADPKAEENMAYPVEFCGGTHLSNTAAAGKFALISEEGIAKGIRRIIAVTGAEASAAIAAADELEAKIKAAQAKPPAEVVAETTDLKIAVDQAAIPAARKAALRDQVQILLKAVLEEQKKAGAANKAKAVEAAVEAADKAAESGQTFLITKVPDVGLDVKALQEAWNAIQKRHPGLAVMFFAEGDGKGLAYAGVPNDLSKKLPAGEWVKAALEVLGGKGGGKPTNAQGMGPKVEALDDAAKVAAELAALKLN